MPQAAIVAVLRHIIGLNPEAIGPEVIARAMRHRMVQCSASDLQTYLERLQTSEQELHALIDEASSQRPGSSGTRCPSPISAVGRG